MVPFFHLAVILSLSLLLIGAGARPGVHFQPCKAFLLSYSFTTSSSDAVLELSGAKLSRIYTMYPVITSSGDYHPPNYYSFNIGPWISIRRSRTAWDVIPISAMVLFAIGCCMIAWATVYLIWTIAAARFGIYGEDEDEENPDEEFVCFRIIDA